MSDLMLLGVLRQPLPDDPAQLDALTWAQIRDRMRQAADRIEAGQAIIADRDARIEVVRTELADNKKAPPAARRSASQMMRDLHWAWVVSVVLRYCTYTFVFGLLALILWWKS